MSGVERRRLFCAVLFHCAAALCVIWSLCVLIERAAEEVKKGMIGNYIYKCSYNLYLKIYKWLLVPESYD